MLENSILRDKPIKKHYKTREDMIDLASQTFIYADDFEYVVVEITEATEARPDIISYNMYGSDRYGDLICKLNGIANPFELAAGMLVIVPEVSYVNKFFIRENIDLDGGSGSNQAYGNPTPKRKNERRKPNEAILGDARYRIDKANKIIYY